MIRQPRKRRFLQTDSDRRRWLNFFAFLHFFVCLKSNICDDISLSIPCVCVCHPQMIHFFPSVVNIYSEKKRETIWLKCCHSMLSFHPLNIIFYLVFPIRIHIFRIDIAKWVLSLYLPHKSASLIFSIEIKLWEEVVKLPSYSYQKKCHVEGENSLVFKFQSKYFMKFLRREIEFAFKMFIRGLMLLLWML